MYTAYEIPRSVFDKIVEVFPPKYPDTIGHHVTVEFGVSAETPIPEDAEIKLIRHLYYVIGSSKDVECFIVSVNDSTERPDGGTYHLTWSIDRSTGANPVDSNELVYLATKTTSHDVAGPAISHRPLKRKNLLKTAALVIEPFIAKGKLYK